MAAYRRRVGAFVPLADAVPWRTFTSIRSLSPRVRRKISDEGTRGTESHRTRRRSPKATILRAVMMGTKERTYGSQELFAVGSCHLWHHRAPAARPRGSGMGHHAQRNTHSIIREWHGRFCWDRDGVARIRCMPQVVVSAKGVSDRERARGRVVQGDAVRG